MKKYYCLTHKNNCKRRKRTNNATGLLDEAQPHKVTKRMITIELLTYRIAFLFVLIT